MLSKYFPVTSKEYIELSYLNLRIIKYPCGISIDETSHIQYIILAQWFPDSYEKFNYDTTPFKTDIAFELALLETIPATPDEIHLLEERYLVKLSA